MKEHSYSTAMQLQYALMYFLPQINATCWNSNQNEFNFITVYHSAETANQPLQLTITDAVEYERTLRQKAQNGTFQVQPI